MPIDAHAERRAISPESLTPGQRLAHDLVDAEGRVLLRAFEPIDERAVELVRTSGAAIALGQPGVDTTADANEAATRAQATTAWRIDRELARVRANIRRSAEGVLALRAPRWQKLNHRMTPDAAGAVRTSARLVTNIDPTDAHAVAAYRAQRAGVLAQTYARLASGERVASGALDMVVDGVIDDLAASPTLAAALTLNTEHTGDTLVGHALSTGILAMGVAIACGWSRADVRAAGLAGFLSDVGLTVMPTNLRALDRPLTDEETNALRRHTFYGSAMLEGFRASALSAAVPESVQIAILQHHERLDGSGYPSGLRADKIHDLSRVVAACDVLLAMCEPRAHRPALEPAAALASIVRMGAGGLLDRNACRALVSVVGIYPPGTTVELSTGHVGVTLGHSRPGMPDRPVVRVVSGELIDLARSGASVRKAA